MKFEKLEHYDIDTILRYLLMALAILVFWKVNSGLGAALVSLFVIISVMKQRPIDLLYGVLFIAYTLIGNYHFLLGSEASTIMIRSTLLLPAVLFVLDLTKSSKISPLITSFFGIMVYLLWEALVSIQGFSPIVSYLKLLYFCSVFLALAGATCTVINSPKANTQLVRSSILAIISLVIVGSFLLIPFPSWSQLTGEAAIKAIQSGNAVSLFQGMTFHPQVLGPVTGIMGTFLLADLAFYIKKWDKFYIVLLLLCPFLVYKSSSRTGMGTLIAGMGFVAFLIFRSHGLGTYWKGRLLMAMNMLVVVGAIAICAISSFRGNISRFAFKLNNIGAKSDISLEYMMSSRQMLIDESIRNFKDKPLLGNGFQVSSYMLGMKHSSFFSYLSSPIEKGVWIYAVPEEGGIIGMALLCIWLLFLFKHLIIQKSYICASVFFAFLIANFGEFTFFSMSYLGGICWTLTFAALCLDFQHLKETETLKTLALNER